MASKRINPDSFEKKAQTLDDEVLKIERFHLKVDFIRVRHSMVTVNAKYNVDTRRSALAAARSRTERECRGSFKSLAAKVCSTNRT